MGSIKAAEVIGICADAGGPLASDGRAVGGAGVGCRGGG